MHVRANNVCRFRILMIKTDKVGGADTLGNVNSHWYMVTNSHTSKYIQRMKSIILVFLMCKIDLAFY